MNANELADELDESVMKLVADDHFFEAQAVEKAQTMLRTIPALQAEIEALKAEVIMYRTDAEKLTMRLIDCAVKPPTKELTDEEIISTMVQFDVYSSDDHCLIEAGRAILRKDEK